MWRRSGGCSVRRQPRADRCAHVHEERCNKSICTCAHTPVHTQSRKHAQTPRTQTQSKNHANVRAHPRTPTHTHTTCTHTLRARPRTCQSAPTRACQRAPCSCRACARTGSCSRTSRAAPAPQRASAVGKPSKDVVTNATQPHTQPHNQPHTHAHTPRTHDARTHTARTPHACTHARMQARKEADVACHCPYKHTTRAPMPVTCSPCLPRAQPRTPRAPLPARE